MIFCSKCSQWMFFFLKTDEVKGQQWGDWMPDRGNCFNRTGKNFVRCTHSNFTLSGFEHGSSWFNFSYLQSPVVTNTYTYLHWSYYCPIDERRSGIKTLPKTYLQRLIVILNGTVGHCGIAWVGTIGSAAWWYRCNGDETCGSSYKHFTLINYDSRVVPDLKIPHITTLNSQITCIKCL